MTKIDIGFTLHSFAHTYGTNGCISLFPLKTISALITQ